MRPACACGPIHTSPVPAAARNTPSTISCSTTTRFAPRGSAAGTPAPTLALAGESARAYLRWSEYRELSPCSESSRLVISASPPPSSAAPVVALAPLPPRPPRLRHVAPRSPHRHAGPPRLLRLLRPPRVGHGVSPNPRRGPPQRPPAPLRARRDRARRRDPSPSPARTSTPSASSPPPRARSTNCSPPAKPSRSSSNAAASTPTWISTNGPSNSLPFAPSELIADCFALAHDIREVDMRASPYDVRALGFAPIPIETPRRPRRLRSAPTHFHRPRRPAPHPPPRPLRTPARVSYS
jgi:hypothetical protein